MNSSASDGPDRPSLPQPRKCEESAALRPDQPRQRCRALSRPLVGAVRRNDIAPRGFPSFRERGLRVCRLRAGDQELLTDVDVAEPAQDQPPSVHRETPTVPVRPCGRPILGPRHVLPGPKVAWEAERVQVLVNLVVLEADHRVDSPQMSVPLLAWAIRL